MTNCGMATKRTTPAERKRSRERELNGYARAPTPARRRTVPPQASGIEITDAAFVRVVQDMGYTRVQLRPGPIDWKRR